MQVLESLPAIRRELQSFTNLYGPTLNPTTLERLNDLVIGSAPVPWAVNGMEILFAEYDDLPDAGQLLCAQCAEFIQRDGHRFYAQGKSPPEGDGRGYAIWQFYLQEQNDVQADGTVTRPPVHAEFVIS